MDLNRWGFIKSKLVWIWNTSRHQ